MKDGLCCSHGRIRLVDDQAFALFIMLIGMIAIDCQKRGNGDQLNALPQYVIDRNIVCMIVIGIQCQNTSGKSIHHILAWSLHNDIADKVCRKCTIGSKGFAELI